MMNFKEMFSAIFLVLILSFAPGAHAQSSDDSSSQPSYFVKIDGLSPSSYAKVVKAIRASGLGDVGMACIPVELVRVDLDDPSSMGPEDAKSLISSIVQETSGLISVFQDEMQQESFESACANARYGIQNN